MAIEIVDFPIKDYAIFNSYVKLPEGNTIKTYTKMFLNKGLNDVQRLEQILCTSKNGQKIAYDHSILVLKSSL